ncbi:riboflavin kinase/fmn adenylyltransferase [Anaeramoeba ignava]|uniref:riboflavin kinase n=1 Tax=Anaeramoeba ignava TaxID=1746090 RepID=A0A9Q0RCL2_ANAIG|nr:riboflavin kinase/fmn adenylyltransferase [Anaeramoeba ignava]
MNKNDEIDNNKLNLIEKPFILQGKVIHGFGRGKKIGFPTANLEYSEDFQKLSTGVFFGFAKLNKFGIFKMVMTIGCNPSFENKIKTVEAHLLHEFNQDFYNEHLSLIICGYIRPLIKFSSIDELLQAIQKDRDFAEKELEDSKYNELRKCENLDNQNSNQNQNSN